MKSILSLIVILSGLSANAAEFSKCHLAYQGCMTPGAKCMPTLENEAAVKAALVKTFAKAPNHAVMVICKGWKKWKAVESFPQFKETFESHAKHWMVVIRGEAKGPFSFEQMKLLKAGAPVKGAANFTLTEQDQVWSGLRTPREAGFRSAGKIDELLFKIFLQTNPSEDDVVL